MPNLIITMKPEEGWDKRTLYKNIRAQALREKAAIIENSPHIVAFDAGPLIKGHVNNLTLSWRYKQFKKT